TYLLLWLGLHSAAIITEEKRKKLPAPPDDPDEGPLEGGENKKPAPRRSPWSPKRRGFDARATQTRGRPVRAGAVRGRAVPVVPPVSAVRAEGGQRADRLAGGAVDAGPGPAGGPARVGEGNTVAAPVRQAPAEGRGAVGVGVAAGLPGV